MRDMPFHATHGFFHFFAILPHTRLLQAAGARRAALMATHARAAHFMLYKLTVIFKMPIADIFIFATLFAFLAF